MRTLKYTLIALLLVISISFTACSQQQNATGNQFAVTRGDLTVKVNGNGKTGYDEFAKLGFGAAGQIATVPVKKGDTVNKGAVLAQLDTSSLELALSEAKVNKAAAEVALSQAKMATTQAELASTQARSAVAKAGSAITEAETAVTAAQINFDKIQVVRDLKDHITRAEWRIEVAKTQLTAARKLDSGDADYWKQEAAFYEAESAKYQGKLTDLLTKPEYTGVAAYEFEGQLYDRLVVVDVRLKEQQLKTAQQAVEIAKLDAEQARQNAILAEQNIEKTKKSIDQAELTLDQAVKAVAAAQKQLEYASITAPFNGTIANLEIKQGDFITGAGISTAPPVYMVNPASLEINTNIDEIDIANVRPGQKAVIQLDTFPGSAYDGVVDSISLTPVENPQSPGVVIYSVKIKFAGNPPPEVRSGMSANIDIITQEKKGVLLVPNKSIDRTSQDQGTVSVISGEKIEPRQVVLGSTDGVQTEVVSGLQDGDVILSLGTGSKAG